MIRWCGLAAERRQHPFAPPARMGAATFMILGGRCTRGCGFCSVQKLNPRKHDLQLDAAEPANVARTAHEMKLDYVVITSVS